MATIIGTAGSDTLAGVPRETNLVDGRAGDDLLRGAGLADTLIGLGGDDTLNGRAGDDTVFGGAGDDRILVAGSEAAGDRIEGGAGTDTIVNIGDRDLVLRAAFSVTGIEAFEGGGFRILFEGGGTLSLAGIAVRGVTAILGSAAQDRITGGSLADTIAGLGAVDTLAGGAGDDRLYGGEAADQIFGGDGNDLLDGGAGNDLLRGGAGDDILLGGDRRDTMRGEGGDDILLGGLFGDVLFGGAGRDVFRLLSASESVPLATGMDRIMDFETGIDLVDLRDIDAVPGGADDAFVWRGQQGFTGRPGELRLRRIAEGPDWYLEGDLDGDRGVDLRIFLAGLGATTDFGDNDILN